MSIMADRVTTFLRDRRGGVAAVFGLAITVLFGVVGFAIDFSRVHAAKLSAQGAMDAAMMTAARKETISDQIVEDTIDTYMLLADSMKHGATQVSSAGRVLDGGTTVEGEVVLRVPTRLLNVMGYSHVDVKIASRVMRGLGNVEIALVLDTTKSMEGSRLASVKTASTQLVDTLFALPDASSKVKVSVVPFGQYVNVGLSRLYELDQRISNVILSSH